MISKITEDVTWIHHCHDIESSRHIHSSSYLIDHNDKRILIDTGDLSNKDSIVDDINEATKGEGIDSLFVSKSHMPHSANVTDFVENWDNVDLIFPGGIPDVHGFPPVKQWPHEGTQTLFGREFTTVRGPLKDLAHSTWLYDRPSEVLFSIDGFCYYHQPGDCNKMSSDIRIRIKDIRDLNASILYWLRYTDPKAVIQSALTIPDKLDPKYIVPSHGNPIEHTDINDFLEKFEVAVHDISELYNYSN